MINHGINATFTITDISSAFGQLKDGQTKATVDDIINLAKEGNVSM